MTTAREQAREAARINYYGHSRFKTTFLDRHADAASDIWEPLLREAVAHLEAHLPGTPMVDRMKEALGHVEA